MVDLPQHFNRGDRVEAQWFDEIVRRIGVLENLRFNPGDFNEIDVGSGRSVSLAAQPKREKKSLPGALRYGYITDASVAQKPRQVMVQFVEPRTVIVDSVPKIQWFKVGEPRVAIVPLNFLASDFELLVRTSFSGAIPVVRADKLGEHWVVSLEPRWAIRELPSGLLPVRC